MALSIGHPKAMAPHSSTLAWKIPRIEEPGRLQSMGSLRVGHDWATSLSLFTFMQWEENPRDGGTAEPGGLPSQGSHRVRRDWSDLAAAAAASSLHNCRLLPKPKEAIVFMDPRLLITMASLKYVVDIARLRLSYIMSYCTHGTTWSEKCNIPVQSRGGEVKLLSGTLFFL